MFAEAPPYHCWGDRNVMWVHGFINYRLLGEMPSHPHPPDVIPRRDKETHTFCLSIGGRRGASRPGTPFDAVISLLPLVFLYSCVWVFTVTGTLMDLAHLLSLLSPVYLYYYTKDFFLDLFYPLYSTEYHCLYMHCVILRPGNYNIALWNNGLSTGNQHYTRKIN